MSLCDYGNCQKRDANTTLSGKNVFNEGYRRRFCGSLHAAAWIIKEQVRGKGGRGLNRNEEDQLIVDVDQLIQKYVNPT